MNNNYLIPANSKKSMLIFSMFNKFDIILFGTGIFISGILVMVVPVGNIWVSILSIIPACVTGFLVFPVPNYHNILTVIISAWNFLTERRKFIWKGWCVASETEKDE